MLRTNLWNDSVSRVVLDHRHARPTSSLSGSNDCLCTCRSGGFLVQTASLSFSSADIYGGARRESRTMEPLSDRPPSRMPTIIEVWRLEEALR
jgi:hypothetical protein